MESRLQRGRNLTKIDAVKLIKRKECIYMLTPFVIDIILFCPPMQRAAFFWAITNDYLRIDTN